MLRIILSLIFILFLCVPVYGQATAEPGGGSAGGDFTTGDSSGTFTTGPSDGTFTTENNDFTTESDQPGRFTTDPQTSAPDSNPRSGRFGTQDRPAGSISAQDQGFITQTESRLNNFGTRIDGIRQRRLQSVQGLDQSASDQLTELERRRDALQNDISGARERNAGLDNQTEIERELRDLDREITRIEQRL